MEIIKYVLGVSCLVLIMASCSQQGLNVKIGDSCYKFQLQPNDIVFNQDNCKEK
jgi:hypothetical protein